jgi:uncharacterized protein YjbJ (UPF0337 family)
MEVFILNFRSDETKDTDTSKPVVESTRTEGFAKTATAAKMSGTYNETAGFIKRKFGELTEDSSLEDVGKNQQLLGKIHRLVGSLRGTKEATLEKLKTVRIEVQAVCHKHGGSFLDVATEFVEDIKKALFK